MRAWRLLAGVLAPLLLVVAILAVFALTFDANRYKPELVALVKEQTGRDFQIDGDLHLSFYPNIALELGKARLGNAKGFGSDAFATAENARIEVQLLPLLAHELKVNQVHLRGLKLNLHRNKAGKTNWEDLMPQGKGKADAEVGEAMAHLLGGMVLAGVSVQDSQVQWRDERGGKHLVLQPLEVRTGAFQPGEPVPIRLATTVQQSQPTPQALQVELATTAQQAEDKDGFTLEGLEVKVQVPAVWQARATGNLQGKLSAQQLAMPDWRADLKLEGWGEATLAGQLSANLAKDVLQVEGLAVEAKGNIPSLGPVAASLAGKWQTHLRTGAGLLDFPQASLNLAGQQLAGQWQMRDPLLPTRVAEGKLTAEQLAYPPFVLHQASLGFQWQEGRWRFTPQGKLFQGAYQGDLTVDTAAAPVQLGGKHKLQGAQVEEWLSALGSRPWISGRLDIDAELAAPLGEAALATQHLQGNLRVQVQEGALQDGQLATQAQAMLGLLGKRQDVKGVIPFDRLAATWQVQQGVFRTEDAVLLAPPLQAKGSGKVDLGAESLDLNLRLSGQAAATKADAPSASLRIHGPRDKPTYTLELEALALPRLDKGKLDAAVQEVRGQDLDALQQERGKLKEALEQERAKLKEALQQEGGKLQQLREQWQRLSPEQREQLQRQFKGLF